MRVYCERYHRVWCFMCDVIEEAALKTSCRNTVHNKLRIIIICVCVGELDSLKLL